MVCSRIMKLARKWQKMTAMGSKRFSSPKTIKPDCFIAFIASLISNKGHFVVYTTDQRRFTMPLSYLSNNIFLQLFNKSEEEFGLSSNQPITLPCDAEFMNYLVSLIQQGLEKDLEKILIDYIWSSCIKEIQASNSFLGSETERNITILVN